MAIKYNRNAFNSQKYEKEFQKRGVTYANASVQAMRKFFIPIDNNGIKDSVKVSVKGNFITISSIDYYYRDGSTRYELEDSSVAKNRNKHHWFEKTMDYMQPSVKKIMGGK